MAEYGKKGLSEDEEKVQYLADILKYFEIFLLYMMHKYSLGIWAPYCSIFNKILLNFEPKNVSPISVESECELQLIKTL